MERHITAMEVGLHSHLLSQAPSIVVKVRDLFYFLYFYIFFLCLVSNTKFEFVQTKNGLYQVAQ